MYQIGDQVFDFDSFSDQPRGARIELSGGPAGATRIVTFGGANTLGRNEFTGSGSPPTLSQ